MMFHFKKISLFKAEPHKRKYLRFMLHLFKLSLYDLFISVFLVVLLVFPWRRAHAKRVMARCKISWRQSWLSDE